MFKFIKKLFSKDLTEKQGEVINVNVSVDLSKKSIQKRELESQQEYENRWKYVEPNIEYTYDDGTVRYETQWVNWSERNEIGFLGQKHYSNNKQFCFVYVASNDFENNIALIDVTNQNIIFKLKLDKPSQCSISDKGISVIIERKSKSDKLIILDLEGNILYEKRHNYMVSYTPFNFIENETQFIYETHYNHKKFKIDL